MRRFIAGAVCPRCRAVDRIVVEEVAADDAVSEAGSGIRRRRCVSCGYSDTLRTGHTGEPPGRFARGADAAAPATRVRIVGDDD